MAKTNKGEAFKQYQHDKFTIVNADCLDYLKTLSSNSIGSIVTDPPYGIKFLNRHWDVSVPSVEVWRECLRVVKPGGLLLSFAGTRTHHKMVFNIEQSGFEIIDLIAWVYGSGFPKSLNISKAFDKLEKKGQVSDSSLSKKYQGYGTALKPAFEPITVARKWDGSLLTKASTFERFIYCAKASTSERNNGLDQLKNTHPTVKPLGLMQQLVSLSTEPGEICLDPFMGSGTTGCACIKEARRFIGIERERDFCRLSKHRILAHLD